MFVIQLSIAFSFLKGLAPPDPRGPVRKRDHQCPYDLNLQGELPHPSVNHWVWFIAWSPLRGLGWVINVELCVTEATPGWLPP
jgi:hypothetical protein